MFGATLLVLAAVSAPPGLERSLSALERTIARPRAVTPGEWTAGTDPRRDLDSLRRRWMTPKRFEILAKRYETPALRISPQVRAEIAFRLARHAYLLDRDADADVWAARVEDAPETAEWKAKALYVQGVVRQRAGNPAAAGALFEAATAKVPDSAEISALAWMALARLAFDRGRYGDAQKLFSRIPRSARYYEDSLQESAWSSARLSQPERASTEIDLLFTLYPQSRRLPEAGFLLGSLMEGQYGLERKSAVLDRMLTRLSFEVDATQTALSAYEGHEEDVLSELDLELTDLAVKAVLPPIGKELLEKDPVPQTYLANLGELDDDRWDLLAGRDTREVLRRLLREPYGTTIDEVTALEWANDIEWRLHNGGEPAPGEAAVFRKKRKELKELGREIAETADLLREVDRNIGLNWLALSGQRGVLAVGIKKKLREELSRVAGQKLRAEKAELSLEVVALRNRKRIAIAESGRLKSLRSPEGSADPFLARLDAARDQARSRSAEERRVSLEKIAAGDVEFASRKKKMDRARALLGARARRDLKRVLLSSRDELVGILRKYRWASADARYRLLRATERELADARRRAALESNDLEQRYGPFDDSRPGPPSPDLDGRDFRSPAALRRREDTRYFLARRSEYLSEIDGRIRSAVNRDRVRYRKEHAEAEAKALDDQARSRERAIFSHQLWLRDDPKSIHTPYALYRVAQLMFERAEGEAALGSTREQNEEIRRYNYDLAVAPLDRIRREFPSFPYRDAAMYLLGYALLENRRPEESLAAFEQLATEYPKGRLAPEVYLRIGEHYFNGRKFARAIPAYQQVLTFGFNFFYDKALYKLAWSNYRLGRYDSAIAHFLILLDYSEELAVEDRTRFVEFADEAAEYVAFSLFRSGGAPTARRIFTKTGWKPYGLRILIRMAQIASDRGERKAATDTYALAASQYPLAPELTGVLRNRIQILEETKDDALVLREMEGATERFSAGGDWRRANRANADALSQADALDRKALFTLASRFEASGRTDRARTLFAALRERHPESEEAYEASFRLGEIAFAAGDQARAIEAYDRVSKSGRFDRHFADVLFGIVASRAKILADRGGADAAVAKAGGAKPKEAADLLAAIDNFARRLPRDPRLPEALYRAALVHEKLGEYDAARADYAALGSAPERGPWRAPALVALVNLSVAQEKWDETAQMAREVLREHPDLEPEAKKQVESLLEGARFKKAESLAASGKVEEALTAYTSFRNDFPNSTFAPKALFNAFAIGKKDAKFDVASSALDSLLKNYPRSEEATSVRYEQALLHDALFDFDPARREYRDAIANGLPKDRLKIAALNLARIERFTGRSAEDVRAIAALPAASDPSLRADLTLLAADLAADLHETARSSELYALLAHSDEAPLRLRALAAARLAGLRWAEGKPEAAVKAEKAALRFLEALPEAEQAEPLAAAALAAAIRVTSERKTAARTKLTFRSERQLASTFKKRAGLLSGLEASVLNLLKLGSPVAGASALRDLGRAYRDFAAELKRIPAPEEGKEEFQKTISALTVPLEQKSSQALLQALKLLREARLPAPFADDLFADAEKAGIPVPAAPRGRALWAERFDLPDLPEDDSAAGARGVIRKIRDGDSRGALETARAFLKSRPRSALAHQILGLAFKAAGEKRLARLALERAYGLAPGNSSVEADLAPLFAEPGDLAVRGALLKSSAGRGDPAGGMNWAKSAWDVREYAAACEEWKHIGSRLKEPHPVLEANLRLCSEKKEEKR